MEQLDVNDIRKCGVSFYLFSHREIRDLGS